MSDPSVSVLIPVRNGAAFILDAVESVLSQEGPDLELVVVNDASTDETSLILDSVDDPRLRVIDLDETVGTPRALNVGIEACQADLTARLDADDRCLPGRFAVQTEGMERHPDLLALGSGALLIDEKGAVRGRRDAPTGASVLRMLKWRNAFIHSSMMYRTAAVRSVGGYSPLCRRCQDYELWLRLAAIGDLDNLREPLVGYRVHSGQATAAKIHDPVMFKAIGDARVALAKGRGESVTGAKLRQRLWVFAQWKGDLRRT